MDNLHYRLTFDLGKSRQKTSGKNLSKVVKSVADTSRNIGGGGGGRNFQHVYAFGVRLRCPPSVRHCFKGS